MSDSPNKKRARQTPPGIVLQPLLASAQLLKPVSTEDEVIKVLNELPVNNLNVNDDGLVKTLRTRVENKQETVSMDLIEVSPYQNRIFNKDSDEFIAELAANIYKEELNNPIIVRRLANGKLELLAGENRYRAYQINGMSEIPATIKEMDDISAAKTTILDNVFHSPVSAYELYLGYDTLITIGAYQNMSQLAKDVGLSKAEMSRLFSFKKFPSEVNTLLAQSPKSIGSNTAYDLIKYVDSHPELLLEAIKKIIGGMDQKRASGWIQSKIDPKVPPFARIITNSEGKTKFTVKRKANSIQIITDKEDVTADVAELIYKLLESEAKNVIDI
jgi:ParB family chromosome partitioning protein